MNGLLQDDRQRETVNLGFGLLRKNYSNSLYQNTAKNSQAISNACQYVKHNKACLYFMNGIMNFVLVECGDSEFSKWICFCKMNQAHIVIVIIPKLEDSGVGAQEVGRRRVHIAG